jgi:parvulin-like peptidyl-prolyl isomerase
MLLEQVFKTTARQFEEDIRGSLIIERLRDAVIKDVTLTEEELRAAYRNENEKSRISYILVSPDEFKDGAAAEAAAIEAYYKNNAELFRVPDQANIEYLGFEYRDYQGDKAKALEAAEKIDYALADKTKTLQDAARENSLLIKETGFFSPQGPIPQIGWFPDIQRAAFKLKVGETSGLIKSNMDFVNGYYIIRLKEKKPSYIPELAEVRDRVISKVKDAEAAKLAREEAYRLRTQITGLLKPGAGKFEEAAAALKRQAKQSEPFARNGYIQAIGSASELGEAAFALKAGEISPVMKTEAGFCLFTTLEVTPVNEENFKKDREEFFKKTLESKKTASLSSWYADLMRRAGLKSNIPSE